MMSPSDRIEKMLGRPDKRPGVSPHDAMRAKQIRAARIVMTQKDKYGPGLVRWAKLVLKQQ
jgi:hypothetical protein